MSLQSCCGWLWIMNSAVSRIWPPIMKQINIKYQVYEKEFHFSTYCSFYSSIFICSFHLIWLHLIPLHYFSFISPIHSSITFNFYSFSNSFHLYCRKPQSLIVIMIFLSISFITTSAGGAGCLSLPPATSIYLSKKLKSISWRNWKILSSSWAFWAACAILLSIASSVGRGGLYLG